LKLHRRRERDKAGRFLAEGPQAVREALVAGCVVELFVTAALSPDDLVRMVGDMGDLGVSSPPFVQDHREGVRVSVVDEQAMAALTETVTPQGVVALCERIDVTLGEALGKRPKLVSVLVEIRDPGNAGTILRTADAAGAGAVIFAGEAVDPYNGKCVRASAGSLFHVDVVRERDVGAVLRGLEPLKILATSGRGENDLFEVDLGGPTAWLFGGEAHGLPDELLKHAERVRVPLYGMAESLNLASAAAVCLYASARAHHSTDPV
jgi:TrmH family RNA methyltransferase